jgi:hypothetical protein
MSVRDDAYAFLVNCEGVNAKFPLKHEATGYVITIPGLPEECDRDGVRAHIVANTTAESPLAVKTEKKVVGEFTGKAGKGIAGETAGKFFDILSPAAKSKKRSRALPADVGDTTPAHAEESEGNGQTS